MSKLDFNKEIQENLIEIKLKTLHYALRVFDYLSQMANAFPKSFLSSNMDLLKLFIINTFEDRILLRTCECIEIFKKKHLFFFENVCIFDGQIEEILMNKKAQIMKNLAKSKTSRLSVSRPLQDSPAISPMIPMDYSLEQSKKVSIIEANLEELKKTKSIFMYPVQREETNKEEKSQEFEDEIEKEKRIKKQFIEELDKWLCFDETNLISINENISISMKLTENLEIFLNFIINPFKFPIESYVTYVLSPYINNFSGQNGMKAFRKDNSVLIIDALN